MHLNEYITMDEVNIGNLSLFCPESIGWLLNVQRNSAAKKVDFSALDMRRVTASAAWSPLKGRQMNNFFLATVAAAVVTDYGRIFRSMNLSG